MAVSPIEAEIHARAEADDATGAVAALVRGYGPEIWTYLAGVLRSGDADLADVFAAFCEDVCRGLPGFRFAASARAWAYVVARRAALRHLRDARRHARRFDGPAEIERIAEQVRSTTALHLRTTNHD